MVSNKNWHMFICDGEFYVPIGWAMVPRFGSSANIVIAVNIGFR